MPTRHNVQDGECIHSISASHGFFWETIWNHGDNADLRQRRGDSQVLYAGDVLTIPDKEPKQDSGATEAKHRFKLKGVPVKVRIQVKRNDEPRANVPYRIDIDGKLEQGTTDGDGVIEVRIPPRAQGGQLFVGPPDDEEVYPFRLGTVDPVDTEEGVRGRLFDLGYDNTLPIDVLLREFQAKEGLPTSGELDAATKGKLKEVFGE